ncbi:hypothetical protein MKW98_013676 [Papaver atlanticum]|uniref:tRNA synthetases class I catalytic domain-containing protein n=1 Tax=Papaver atlanticum TaxID=357466 RepID=A0AAD4S6J1_9MAGN|nr:hypothetical protein MKW98_013676 [Papaver atlanticum]
MVEREFQLYNSMTKKKEIFIPKEPGKVGIYVGGVPAYDLSHIHNARAYAAVDVLYRYLKHLGYQVTYVRKYSDIDDKIIKQAEELEEEPSDLLDEYLSDMRDLNVLTPTEQPRVSENMDEIKNMIAEAAKPGEISWESPWGPGRPGWHIECSAMSDRYPISSFDIHGGGRDLLFLHEKELAQSCAARPNTCEIKYWMHNGFVDTNNKQKRTSPGNFSTIREITKLHHPLALRYLMASTHYRSPVNYSLERLELASLYVSYIYETLLDCKDALYSFREENPVIPKTRGLLSAGAFKEILILMNQIEKIEQQDHSSFYSLAEMEKAVKMVLDTFGLMSSSSYSEVLRQFKVKALRRAKLTEEDVLQQIEVRTQALKDNDSAKSDQIRRDLTDKGIFLYDEGYETQWKPCFPDSRTLGTLVN